MNHFEKHGLMHLSASTINLWISQPALALLKIAGIDDGEAGAAAWRGKAADIALGVVANDHDICDPDLIDIAYKKFDKEVETAQNHHDPIKIDRERSDIHRYIENGAKFYRSIEEKPESLQGKITTMLPDVPIPWVGYYDLLYHDKVRDTKTVGRMVSEPTQAHARQASIYGYHLKKEPWLDYVGKNDVRAFKIENVSYHIRQCSLAAQALERVLSVSSDIFECCQMIYPDIDDWHWGDVTRAAAKDIWKMRG